MDILALPFNKSIGLSCRSVDGREWMEVVAQPDHLNHVGTMHAGVLYAVAEAATGHALIRHFEERGSQPPTAVVRSASLRYRQPARTGARAIAAVEQHSMANLEDQLERSGRGLIDVEVVAVNEESQESLSGHFRWFLATQNDDGE